MSRRGRLTLFAVAGTGWLAVLVIGFGGLPAFGTFRGVYGVVVNRIEPGLRHATDIVTALNFDLRAFDTLGEEFILFGSVAGVALLLRHVREDRIESSGEMEHHRFAHASAVVRAAALLLLSLLTALGIYVIAHGQLTPGGGFQGGIVIAAGPLVVMLAGRYLAIRGLAPDWVLEIIDAGGAAAYALIGVGGLVFASTFLENFLPLGTSGDLLSAGTIPLNSVAVGLEVSGAVLLMWTEFLDQALITEPSDASR